MDVVGRPEDVVDKVIAMVGRDLRIATPLAAGKPNHLLNAFYRRVKDDASLTLEIYTALTLEKPKGASDLERRFYGPFTERVFGDYPDLDYELDRMKGKMPKNIRVCEFYFPAGKFKNNTDAQRHYMSSNYTDVARDLMDRRINVLMQQVAPGEVDGRPAFSLSCNPDVSPDLLAMMERRLTRGKDYVFVGQVNNNLPFMLGDAVIEPEKFDFIVDNEEQHYRIFGPPKMPVPDTDFIIGLYASALVRDGGELQVGIGALGDAVVYALLLRHENNALYRKILDGFNLAGKDDGLVEKLGGTAPFDQGLFAASEMLVDGFLHLFKRGIIKRRVYDDVPLQRLLNSGRIDENVSLETIDALLEERALEPLMTEEQFRYLQRFGILRSGLHWENGQVRFPDGEDMTPDLASAGFRGTLEEHGLGEKLQGGAVMHGGFFLGPGDFYQGLRDLTDEERQLIRMRTISRINQLYGHEEIDRLHRRHARFINTGMMLTLSGAVVSDGLADGRMISGIGGQYNFVAMAQALPDGYSLLQVRSTRQSGRRVLSNIVQNYGHISIPRHLRDIIITEYGVANLRGRTDEEIVKSILRITDSRFQEELARAAKKRRSWTRPGRSRQNGRIIIRRPCRRLWTVLRQKDAFRPFPSAPTFRTVSWCWAKLCAASRRKPPRLPESCSW